MGEGVEDVGDRGDLGEALDRLGRDGVERGGLAARSRRALQDTAHIPAFQRHFQDRTFQDGADKRRGVGYAFGDGVIRLLSKILRDCELTRAGFQALL